MNILQALILGLVQGLTEFIPVSSSGHLVIFHELLNVPEGGLTFDVALHVGTLIALLVFFFRDIAVLVKAVFIKSSHTRLAWLLALATIPAVIVGILLESAAESTFRSPRLVSINLILAAVIMLFAERYILNRKKRTSLVAVSRSQALIMGLAQAAAIVPGISRSGSTITAGIFAGLDRVAATRFSFLLAIPITFGAILKVGMADNTINQINNDAGVFVAGIMAAFLSGIFAIKFLLKYLSNHGLQLFAYYRIVLGLLMLLMLTI